MQKERATTESDSRENLLTIPLVYVRRGDIALVGGKGANLGEMLHADINVPPGFVVTTRAYREFMEENDLYAKLHQLLSAVDVNDSAALSQAANQMQEAVLAAPMSDHTRATIEKEYETLGHVPVAARSSATAEDLAEASFAGQQRTSLNVVGADDVIQAVQACWASLFEARAIFYREANGFPHDKVAIAVVVQQMVFSDVSGVMFTAEPSTYNREILLIEAIYGLGEPIVSGALSPDAYLVNKSTLTITSREIAVQPWLLRRNESGRGFDQGTFQEQVPPSLQGKQKLSDEHIIELTRLGTQLEKVYGGQPQDVEWALADNTLYIVQTRPITTLRRTAQRTPEGPSGFDAIMTGAPASPGIAAGPVRVIRGAHELSLVKEGDVLVTEMTTPDFVPAMKRAAAIVTDRGGRTCHAAIVSREMGIPCIVGTGDATRALYGIPVVTVDAGAGRIYRGDIAASLAGAEASAEAAEELRTRTRLYVNLADPDAAERVGSTMDVDGVGLLRAEFIMAHIGEHPRAMLESGRGGEFTERLAEGLETFAKAFHPRPIVYRFSDFKTNEYRNLRGGEAYEPQEENPMLGYRGCSRYLMEPDLFRLETDAIKRVRGSYDNLWVMLPFVRTVQELRNVKGLLKLEGLESREDFKVWMMLEVPSNVLLLDDFLNQGVDGVSIGSNDLTQLILGVDRDNERLAEVFDERNPAVLKALEQVIRGCKAKGVTVSICGQAPSEYPELTEKLVSWGITSISVTPDMLRKTRRIIHDVENF